jgi:hypothetical protein
MRVKKETGTKAKKQTGSGVGTSKMAVVVAPDLYNAEYEAQEKERVEKVAATVPALGTLSRRQAKKYNSVSLPTTTSPSGLKNFMELPEDVIRSVAESVSTKEWSILQRMAKKDTGLELSEHPAKKKYYMDYLEGLKKLLLLTERKERYKLYKDLRKLAVENGFDISHRLSAAYHLIHSVRNREDLLAQNEGNEDMIAPRDTNILIWVRKILGNPEIAMIMEPMIRSETDAIIHDLTEEHHFESMFYEEKKLIETFYYLHYILMNGQKISPEFAPYKTLVKDLHDRIDVILDKWWVDYKAHIDTKTKLKINKDGKTSRDWKVLANSVNTTILNVFSEYVIIDRKKETEYLEYVLELYGKPTITKDIYRKLIHIYSIAPSRYLRDKLLEVILKNLEEAMPIYKDPKPKGKEHIVHHKALTDVYSGIRYNEKTINLVNDDPFINIPYFETYRRTFTNIISELRNTWRYNTQLSTEEKEYLRNKLSELLSKDPVY